MLFFNVFRATISFRKAVDVMIKSRLKVQLAMNDMTQTQLSKITGIRQPTISALCRGVLKHIPVDVLDKICNALHCQPGDLLEHRPDETK